MSQGQLVGHVGRNHGYAVYLHLSVKTRSVIKSGLLQADIFDSPSRENNHSWSPDGSVCATACTIGS